MNPQEQQVIGATQSATMAKENNFGATKKILMLLAFVAAGLLITALVRAGGVTITGNLENGKTGGSVLVCEDSAAVGGGYVQLGRVNGETDC